ncbi:MAG TPA: hypothetical protein VLI91_08380, partial [Roseiarcus sp.]|nr:hypothetical protein [Roseiarcus sp.]
MATFIVDCPICKAKVAAEEKGRAEHSYFDQDAGEPYAERIHVGKCPSCNALLAGISHQIAFEDFEGSEENEWSDIVRVYPRPPKTF